MRCSTHEKGFTIYPPGWAPYLRKPLAPLAPDGSPISGENDDERFRGTYFDAALDAADQCAWPAEGTDGHQQQRFPTQVRHLHQCALLLGIAPSLHEHLREETAQILDAPGQRLYDSAALIKMSPGYQRMGQAICDILDSLPENTSVFERLIEAGAGLCFWPSPLLWDERLKILRPTPYQAIRTRGSPG